MQKDDKLSFGAVAAREVALLWRFCCAQLSRAMRGTLWQAWQSRRGHYAATRGDANGAGQMPGDATGVPRLLGGSHGAGDTSRDGHASGEIVGDNVDAWKVRGDAGGAAPGGANDADGALINGGAAPGGANAAGGSGAGGAGGASASPSLSADEQSAVIDKLTNRFAAKLDARERRQQQLQRQREHDEQQQALIDPRVLPASAEGAPEQLELALEQPAASAPAALVSPVVMPAARLHGEAYLLPPLALLVTEQSPVAVDESDIAEQRKLIQDCLDSFNIDADVGTAICGPRVTLYQVNVARGVRVGMVSAIGKDLCMALSAQSLRILAPVPGHDYVGIEVPNRRAQVIRCGGVLFGPAWGQAKGLLPVIMGRNIQGEDVFLDLSKAPHLLVAGATGSGKSVCLNAILMSLLYRFSPEELQLILVDPKVVEMNVYAKLPHLVVPVITDVQLVVLALRWLINEMGRRYRVLAKVGVRNLESFNSREPSAAVVLDDEGQPIPAKMPYIVLVIDELADIMLSSRADVESGLARIAQMSRAVGIHTIVATQRPSVNVITGVIKANFPTRVAFQVSSQVDSRTIIDGKGAESLLGAGDMLFKPPTASRIQRLQGAMVTDAEIERVVEFCAAQGDAAESFEVIKQAAPNVPGDDSELADADDDAGAGDENESLVRAAMEIVIRDHKASISYVQRRLRIGYNRAATLIDTLEKRGVIGPQLGSAPREILVDSMEAAVGDEDY